MDYKVDLHMHSYASDGQWRPEEIIQQVEANGIQLFSVTDHDEITCAIEVDRLAKGKSGLNYIKGVEISAEFEGRECHILTYGIKEGDEELLKLLEENRRIRDKYNEKLVEYLVVKHEGISLEDYRNYKYNPYQGGWLTFCYLRDRGLTTGLGDYFKLIKEFEGKAVFPHPKEVLTLLNRLGYVTVLAHPAAYTDDDFYPIQLMDQWKTMGIQGIECYTQYLKESKNADYYVEYCKRNDLLITGGSDCHGGFAGRRLGHPYVTKSMVRLPFGE